jgi:hypothetical protein
MSEEKRPEDREEVDDGQAFNRHETPPELKAFEAALASLVPRADRLDRDRLMFLAGQQSPNNCSETTDGGSALRLSHPTSRWAWPGAFAAMTTVAAVLAILLAIRPAMPTADPSGESLVNSANDGKPLDAQVREAPRPLHWESDLDERVQPLSPWLAFLQSFWKAGDASNAAEAAAPAPESLASSYPRLRNDMLRRGIDSWQVARDLSNVFSAGAPPTSTNRELLKQYLPESN